MYRNISSLIPIFILISINFFYAQELIQIDGIDSDWDNVPVLIQDMNEEVKDFLSTHSKYSPLRFNIDEMKLFRPFMVPMPQEIIQKEVNEQNLLTTDIVDIKEVKFFIQGTDAYWFIRFWAGPAWPNNPRGYSDIGHYSILLDLDNNINTGWNTQYYEGKKVSLGGFDRNIGTEAYIEIGLDSENYVGLHKKFNIYYGGDCSQRTYSNLSRSSWGKDVDIYAFPNRDYHRGKFTPDLTSGIVYDKASGGEFSHAWGSDFLEVKQSLLPSLVYWQHQGFNFLKSGDKISIAAHVETVLDNWGDDFTDGAEYVIPEYKINIGSISGKIKTDIGNTSYPYTQFEIRRDGEKIGTTRMYDNGQFCQALIPGKYELKPVWGKIESAPKQNFFDVTKAKAIKTEFTVIRNNPPDIIEKIATTYKNFKGYRDSTIIKSDVYSTSSRSRQYLQDSLLIFNAFERPNRLRYNVDWRETLIDNFEVQCDGKQMIIKNLNENRYTKEKAAAKITTFEVEKSIKDFEGGIFVQNFDFVQKLLLRESFWEELRQYVWGTNQNNVVNLNSIQMRVIECLVPEESMNWIKSKPPETNSIDISFSTPIKIRIWIGYDDHLIYRVMYEFEYELISDEGPKNLPRSLSKIEIVVTEIHKGIETNPKFDKRVFEFNPSPRDTLVERHENYLNKYKQ